MRRLLIDRGLDPDASDLARREGPARLYRDGTREVLLAESRRSGGGREDEERNGKTSHRRVKKLCESP